jgi:hypothetical protein
MSRVFSKWQYYWGFHGLQAGNRVGCLIVSRDLSDGDFVAPWLANYYVKT